MAIEKQQLTPGSLITIRTAARLLGVTPITIRRWIKLGRLKATKLAPRVVRIRREDVEGMIK